MKEATALRIAKSLDRVAVALEVKGTGEGSETPPRGVAPTPQGVGVGIPVAANSVPTCSKCDDSGYTAVYDGLPQWCTCPTGAQYQTEGKKRVYKDGRVE